MFYTPASINAIWNVKLHPKKEKEIPSPIRIYPNRIFLQQKSEFEIPKSTQTYKKIQQSTHNSLKTKPKRTHKKSPIIEKKKRKTNTKQSNDQHKLAPKQNREQSKLCLRPPMVWVFKHRGIG